MRRPCVPDERLIMQVKRIGVNVKNENVEFVPLFNNLFI